VYVPEIVSRGLVPEDLGSFYRQQLKWARGVYEVLFSELLPRWAGSPGGSASRTLRDRHLLPLRPGDAVYLLLPYVYLWTGVQPASMRFAEFLTAGAPVAAIGVALYLFVQRWLCRSIARAGLHWRGLMLKIACWPVYLAGTVLAILRYEVRYVPTAKQSVGRRFPRSPGRTCWCWPPTP
jgi:cellulose synthase (UDP-forming)